MSRLTSIVVTGGQGQLAQCLTAYFPYAEYPGRTELDVANPNSVNRYFSSRSVDLVIHTAAETAYDAPLDALLSTNAGGTLNVTRAAAKQHARMVYLSTDYVYPGLTGSYDEESQVSPIGDYARSKYAGETVALSYVNTLAIRTSFYSRLNWERAATDAFSSRMPIEQAAGLIAALATSGETGIVNVGGPRRSLYEIVSTEFAPRVEAISLKDVRLPYTLPKDVSLDCTKMRRILG